MQRYTRAPSPAILTHSNQVLPLLPSDSGPPYLCVGGTGGSTSKVGGSLQCREISRAGATHATASSLSF